MGSWIFFVVVTAVLLGSAVMVVRSRDLIHCVLWLGVTLVTTAALYVSLHADFVAAAQVLLYAGGVITLMLFAVMLTHRLEDARLSHDNNPPLRGALAAAGLAALVGAGILQTVPGEPLASLTVNTQALGALFLTDLMLPFELLSLLLLAVMIGAITLARKRDA